MHDIIRKTYKRWNLLYLDAYLQITQKRFTDIGSNDPGSNDKGSKDIGSNDKRSKTRQRVKRHRV